MKTIVQSGTDIPLPSQKLQIHMKDDHRNPDGLHKENKNERINRIS